MLNKDDLREILSEMFPSSVAAEVADADETGDKDFLSFADGCKYINSKGLRISKSTLYKKTQANSIPFRRWGGKSVVFVRGELDDWINHQFHEADNTNEIIKTVAAAARKK